MIKQLLSGDENVNKRMLEKIIICTVHQQNNAKHSVLRYAKYVMSTKICKNCIYKPVSTTL